jgi:hypothetical protein
MSLALQHTGISTDQPYRLSAHELALRYYFIAAFTGVEKSEWALRLAVWKVNGELQQSGLRRDAIIRRIQYIAAIPLSFHYRRGYKDAQTRLAQTVEKAAGFVVAR